MKIICDTCGAKYSIADEKVRGKVFKIRCKKCREVIVVRGTVGAEGGGSEEQVATSTRGSQEAPPPADYGSYDAAGGPVWHVVLDGEQQGPYTAEQVAQFVAAGQLDREAYCWRDGFADWMHLCDVPELWALASQVAGPAADDGPPAGGGRVSQPAQEAYGATSMESPPDHSQEGFFSAGSAEGPESAQEAMAGLFGGGGGADDGGLAAPMGAMAAPMAATPGSQPPGMAASLEAGGAAGIAARAPRAGGADLFAQADDGGMFATDSSGDLLPSSSRVESSRLTGTRNENSVLFSLSNLQALASSSGNSPAASTSGAPRTGQASGEGSGLIDIRSMAAATTNGSDSQPVVDDFLALGGGGVTGGPIGVPVLVPQAASGPNVMLYAVLGVGALLVVGLIVTVILLTSNREEAPSVAAVQPAVLVGQPGANPTGQPGAQANPVSAGVQPTPVPVDDEDEQEGSAAGSEGSKNRDTRRPGARTGEKAGSSAPDRGSAAASAASAPAAEPSAGTKRASNDLDALLDGALGGSGGGQPARGSRGSAGESGGGDSSMPAKLSRAQVRAGMSQVEGQVRRCGNGTPGTVVIDVVISGGTGRVSSATVTGQFAGSPVGSCAARAVRAARFPRFREENLTVRGYPFRVN